MTIPAPSIASLTDDELKSAMQQAAGVAARVDDWNGFRAAHYCFWGRLPAPHYESWYAIAQAAWKKSRKGERMAGVLLKCFRAAAKSTFVQTFLAQKVGLFPVLSHVIVAANDIESKKTSELIADLIELNSGWAVAFPNVQPDKPRGWSLNGYHVKDVSQNYNDFVQATQKDHGRDSTFVSVSAETGAVGAHPTGVLILDDIHNNKNTTSKVDMKRITASIRSDVIGTMTRRGAKPLLLDCFTPKDVEDTNALFWDSGVFDNIELPVFRADPDGKWMWDGMPVTLSWPEGEASIDFMLDFRSVQGKAMFRREFLLELSSDPDEELVHDRYPAHLIDKAGWIIYGGVDPSDTDKDRAEKIRNQSHFALAYVAELPTGGACIVDGVIKQCSQAEGEDYILQAQGKFPRWKHTIVEKVGYGRMWFNAAMRNPDLKIVEGNLKGFGFTDRSNRAGNKADRFMKEVYPHVEQGRVKISDANTPFLNAIRKLLQEFKTLDEHDPAWDAWDAVFQALKGMIHVLKMPVLPEEQESQRKKASSNIMAQMLRMSR